MQSSRACAPVPTCLVPTHAQALRCNLLMQGRPLIWGQPPLILLCAMPPLQPSFPAWAGLALVHGRAPSHNAGSSSPLGASGRSGGLKRGGGS